MLRLRRVPLGIFVAAVLAVGVISSTYGQVGQSQLVNPDLAQEKDLLALPHMNAAIVKSILEQRPFLKTADLHALLAKSLTKEQLAELYGKMFVPVNLNTASDEEILLIPGASSRTVKEFRDHRPYKTLAQFRSGLGKSVDAKELARLEQYVFVPVNINIATDDDVLSIPGAGKRMVREFKEYRPWTSFEQFRKEIGKYVDKKEVARLEKYVTLN